jgi:hypothetical protein
MNLDEGDLFVVVRGRPFIRDIGSGFSAIPFQSYDQSYDGYIFKAIKVELDIVVVEVVYARKSLLPWTADETGTRRLINLRDMEIMTVDASFVDALTPPEKPKDTTTQQADKKPDWLERLEQMGWGKSPIEAALDATYKDTAAAYNEKVAKAKLEAERYQVDLLKNLEEAEKFAVDAKKPSADSELPQQ